MFKCVLALISSILNYYSDCFAAHQRSPSLRRSIWQKLPSVLSGENHVKQRGETKSICLADVQSLQAARRYRRSDSGELSIWGRGLRCGISQILQRQPPKEMSIGIPQFIVAVTKLFMIHSSQRTISSELAMLKMRCLRARHNGKCRHTGCKRGIAGPNQPRLVIFHL